MNFIDEFCHKYQAEVRPSNRTVRRAVPVSYSVFQEQGMGAFDTLQCQHIPMVDITMPEDRFRALMEHDHWLANAGLHDNAYFTNNVMRVSNMVVEHERECRLRNQHPALQKAWEQYQIILAMYRSER
jgi:hypothetical protein